MTGMVDSLPPAASGTCVQLTQDEEVWAVRGSRRWYLCDAGAGTCNCEDWKYRRSRTVTPCKHLRSLQSYLLVAAAVRATLAAEQAGRAATAPTVEEQAPLPTDAELRRIFA